MYLVKHVHFTNGCLPTDHFLLYQIICLANILLNYYSASWSVKQAVIYIYIELYSLTLLMAVS